MLATNLDSPVKLTCMSLSCGRNTWKKLIKDHARSLQKQILTKSLAVFVISHVVSSAILPFKSLLSLLLLFIFLTLVSKSGDLEEELKNVTNNLKSLEAQAEKVQ